MSGRSIRLQKSCERKDKTDLIIIMIIMLYIFLLRFYIDRRDNHNIFICTIILFLGYNMNDRNDEKLYSVEICEFLCTMHIISILLFFIYILHAEKVIYYFIAHAGIFQISIEKEYKIY
ncbi:MAG: hypothetical protein Sylvanvirus2_26 [Sylvanvirus sp.]|uniref:Uncharacterized protein n=1 Tax=Sylvanvirus sp. TaxID=2487774 RepID=A0A3G5AH97_9VIRU|nr:MAG: hypothetical protein Sylvanvirus2_26 [Sylvanvirus sp.]